VRDHLLRAAVFLGELRSCHRFSATSFSFFSLLFAAIRLARATTGQRAPPRCRPSTP
jgi:hypothetical protein